MEVIGSAGSSKKDERFFIVVKPVAYCSEDLSKLADFFSTFLRESSTLSDSGYVNDGFVNIKGVSGFLGLVGFTQKKVSNLLNALVYYTLQMLIVTVISDVLKGVSEEPNLYKDVYSDLKSIEERAFRMLHPVIVDRVKNSGLSVVLNTFVGFDSEYELQSSSKNENSLLSVQLAANTNMYVRVPLVEKAPLKVSDF